MNVESQTRLQSYMFQNGNNHSAVKVIKTFLNASSRTSISDLKSDGSFDAKTKSALADFQKSKGLNHTGRMDLKTWLAIGAEMNPIQINVVSMTDQTMRDLLQMGYRSKFPLRKGNGFSGSVETKAPVNIQSAPNDFNFTVYVAAFAPFDWFGPLNLSRGDGNNRRFGPDLDATYRLRAESKMTASPGKRTFPWSVTQAATATDSYLLVPSTIPTGIIGFGIPTVKEKTEKSEGMVSDEDTGEDQPDGLYRESNSARYHFHGNDDAYAFWGDNSLLTSDIDIHADIAFEYEWKSNSNTVAMKASGKITGDQFPAVEAYVLDRNNKGVMLGVWQVNEGDGPVMMRDGTPGIIGDKQLPMIDIDVSIVVENGLFTGVQNFGRIISLAEHNKRFTDLSPVKLGGFKRGFFPVMPIFQR